MPEVGAVRRVAANGIDGAQFREQCSSIAIFVSSSSYDSAVVKKLIRRVGPGRKPVFAYQVVQRWQAGNVSGAADASRTAKVWGIVGIVVGALFWVIWLAAAASAPTYYAS